MSKQLSLFLFEFVMILLLGAAAGYAAPESMSDVPAEARHYQQGMAHFDRGFYELLPRQKKEEAEQEFGLAVQELQEALAIDPTSSKAHKSLARIYYTQKKFLQAAAHYEKVTEFDPRDIDAYVLAALAYAEAREFDKSRAQLEAAKRIATDEQVSKKLDGYLEKLEQWEMEGSR